MFKNKAFLARLFRLLGAALVLSAGYFVYIESELIYSDATIVRYEGEYPVVRFALSPTEQVTYKLTESFNADKHPINSTVEVRFPKDDLEQLEYFSPLLQWAFYIVLLIGLIIFFIGAVLTIQVKKQLKK